MLHPCAFRQVVVVDRGINVISLINNVLSKCVTHHPTVSSSPLPKLTVHPICERDLIWDAISLVASGKQT